MSYAIAKLGQGLPPQAKHFTPDTLRDHKFTMVSNGVINVEIDWWWLYGWCVYAPTLCRYLIADMEPNVVCNWLNLNGFRV